MYSFTEDLVLFLTTHLTHGRNEKPKQIPPCPAPDKNKISSDSLVTYTDIIPSLPSYTKK